MKLSGDNRVLRPLTAESGAAMAGDRAFGRRGAPASGHPRVDAGAALSEPTGLANARRSGPPFSAFSAAVFFHQRYST
jgi:hypothetical protein